MVTKKRLKPVTSGLGKDVTLGNYVFGGQQPPLTTIHTTLDLLALPFAFS